MKKKTIGISVDQVRSEYEEGQDFLRTRKLRWVRQLVLMNNLRRGDQNISTSMLFSFFNRVFSNLYQDKNTIAFIGSEDSEFKKIEALKKLQQFDSQEMDKPLLDYDWLWDTLFFAAGYCETLDFDHEKKLMVPSVINPLMFVYDPYFSEVQKWRYYGKWVLHSGAEIKELIDDGTIDGISSLRDIVPGVEPEIWDYKVKREQAREANPTIQETDSPNKIYQLWEHATYNKAGEKVVAWADRNFKYVLRGNILDLKDGKAGKSKWPVVKKEAFREPHSSIAVSVPDLVEDKHRATAVLYNLSYVAAKDEANPLYVYDQDAVQDESQLLQRQIKQHIPVKGDPDMAIKPMRKNSAVTNSLLSFMGILKNEAAEVIGTTQIAQPAQKGKKTATEAAILQQIADLAGSLQSKVLAIGEKEFWSHWYKRYERYAAEGDKKIISISNVNSVNFEEIDLKDILTKFPPKVMVLSSKEAEYKEMTLRRELSQQFPVFGKIMDGPSLKNFLKFVYFPKFITDSSTIEMMIPKTMDEIKSEQENELLAVDKLSPIDSTDDDETHLYVHYSAKKTAATWSHILAHEKQRADKLKRQQTAPPPQTAGQAKQMPAKETLPQETAAPLKGAVGATLSQ
ncbi:MAG: hypothetical protein M1275_03295 [Patescibacteria group bacterium]|nr:hypothetical protein [Patescibacteria group bacterium]